GGTPSAQDRSATSDGGTPSAPERLPPAGGNTPSAQNRPATSGGGTPSVQNRSATSGGGTPSAPESSPPAGGGTPSVQNRSATSGGGTPSAQKRSAVEPLSRQGASGGRAGEALGRNSRACRPLARPSAPRWRARSGKHRPKEHESVRSSELPARQLRSTRGAATPRHLLCGRNFSMLRLRGDRKSTRLN